MNELIDAVKMGDISQVEKLLPANTDPDRKDTDGLSALGAAAETGNAARVKKLLDAGADVNRADNSGWTPLMSAAAIGNKEWGVTHLTGSFLRIVEHIN